MKILKRIGLVLAIIVGLFVIVGLFLPSTYEVSRSLVINAPAAVVFDQVNDLRKNAAWSPWLEGDPNMKTTIGAISAGVGATSSWTSEQSGSGTMEVIESVPHKSIGMKLDFGDMGGATGFWTFEEVEGGVSATWGFKGDAGWDIPGRYAGLAMDSMVGPHYDNGLAKLKAVAEALPAPVPEPAVEVPAPADEGAPAVEPSDG